MKSLALAAASLLALTLPAFAEPPRPTWSSDPAKCAWTWKTGGGIGVWTERCEMNGVFEPMFSADLPGFVLTVDGKDAGTVLQVFQKPKDADIAAILPELRKRGYIPDDAECVFATAAPEVGKPGEGQAFFEIMPTGARKAAVDATPASEIPEPQCSAYGWSADGVRYFVTYAAHPDRVVYMNIGQDGTMFDPATVEVE